MADSVDFGLIRLFGFLGIDGLHIGSVCLVSKFSWRLHHLGACSGTGTDENNKLRGEL